MSRLVFIVLAVAALALAEFAYHLVRYLGERRVEALKRRLRTSDPVENHNVPILRERHLARSPWLARVLGSFGLLVRLEHALDEADLSLSVAQLLVYAFVLALIGAGMGAIAGSVALGALLAVALGAVPFVVVALARRRRGRRLSAQLPEALDMMARALRAGHGLPAAFRLVAQETSPPLAVEFARAWEQQNLGVSIDQAAVAMSERARSNLDLRLFAVGIVLQGETGGNLVEILENIAQTMRDRFAFFSKLRVLTAEGKLSGLLLGALPWVVGLILWRINPGYLHELGAGTGRVILVAALGLWSLGVLWMTALLRAEY